MRRKIKKAAGLFWEFLKYGAAWCLARGKVWTDPSWREIWLIAERGREARDNGYHFFKYMSERHPEIVCWYVADPGLPDFDRVKKLGQVVPYRSWKHYMLCAASKIKVSTHIAGYTPDIERYYFLDKLHVIHGIKVFLQHGIIKEDIAWYHYPNVKTDLFMCSVKRETEFVKQHFGYPEGVVQCTGMCRFDTLIKPYPVKRQLLIMPTWRKYAVENKTKEEFMQSEYYHIYQELLENERLGKMLEKYNCCAVFYPHYEIQKFIDVFHTASARIQMGYLGKADVQTLLRESSILVTDFSSVQFDFAYMKKPVIYYQFDQEKYYAGHYAKGYFEYEKDGFGPVVQTIEELLEQLNNVMENQQTMTEQYQKRVDAFFGTVDDQNCERTFQAIQKLRKERLDGKR